MRNAFEHGGATFVGLAVDIDADPRRLEIEDDGRPFDPTVPPAAPEVLGPDDVQPRGRGLILVHRFARAIDHRHEAGRNRLRVLLEA